ncbi:ABC transporter permease [Lacrimispora sp. 38-1]|uniref:ABC transporter permease n=1 Tax=Lacrimispora sp. 38-1 TaxID=3125778 RepID=UPI003CFB27FE
MKKFIGKRILMMIPVLLGVAFLIFAIMSFTPGDPAAIILGSQATPEAIQELREKLGLNQSFLSRFFYYIKGIVTRFDFGTSYINGRNVQDEILMRFSYTFRVALLSMAFALGFGIPLGITAAVHRNTWKDRVSMTIALFGISMPTFWFGQMLSIIFALKLGLLPASGVGGIRYYILPCLAVSMMGIAAMARITRSSMLEVIRSDYITTARAKGQEERKIIYKHALRNALIPVVTQAGATFGILLGGTLVAETVFAIPGLGSYMVTSINSRDYPAIQGAVIFIAAVFGVVMLLVDILYAVIDPRIRVEFSKGGK